MSFVVVGFFFILILSLFSFVVKMSSLRNRQDPPREQLWKSWNVKHVKKVFMLQFIQVMVHNIKENGKMIKNMVKDIFCFLTLSLSKQILIEIILSVRIGKGIYVWKSTGDFYEGDFANNTRTGFGTLTVKTDDGKLQRQYAGGWKRDKKHVNLVISKKNIFLKKNSFCRVMEIYFFLIMNIMKENFILIKEMVGEECFMLMDQHMKDNGLMINDMELVC